MIKILGLGSLIMATDAIAALRKQYPQANFILLCNKNLVEGIRPTGLFDEYWALDDNSFFTLALSTFKAVTSSWRLKKL